MDHSSDIVLRSPISNADMRTVVEIQTWLAEQIAELTGCPVESISISESFDSFGLASRDAVALSGDLEEWLSRTLSPTLIYEHPSIEALARFLASGAIQPGPVSAVAVAPIADLPQGRGEPIAIIGLGCRFPGADGPAAFWQLLYDGVDAISEVPPDRWNLTHLYDPRPGVAGKLATRWGGFLDRVDQFDARFFGISPREASRMDPQQRVLLEVAWEALEHAGLPAEQLAGSQTGVFVGVSSSDYALLQYGDPTLIDAYAGTGNATSIAANRLSYVFDLRGPSVAIDTACSSSLVAMHMACQSLRSGESDVAMAGGVNLMVSPELTITFSHARMMATDGRCKTFDASADGYVRGEGCGVVVLKRLTDAQRDGDRILALVRGSAINQDGRSNGLTAPSGLAQQAVVRAALRDAAVMPDQVGYIEAHGTGTALGDPIELRALGAVFAGRPQSAPCLIGSAKTNIGHLEAAAGVAGLIKVVLSLVNQSIPPHLHLREVNPHIPLAELPFRIPTMATPWLSGEQRRIAGVSSFGFGGTNAHVVLEEAPAFVARIVAQDAERPRHVLALSARDEAALCAVAGRYASHLAAQPGLDLRDLCYSANTGRSHLPVRLGLSVGSRDELAQRLAAVAVGGDPAGAFRGMVPNAGRPKVAFLFTGQGSQYAGMGRTLYQSQPVFRAALDRCAAILDQELDHPLLDLLFDGDVTTLRGPLDQTGYTQPALFAIEYALAQLWMSWGVQPDALLGHSVGEYVAACIAGVFSLEDGLRLIAQRGRLMQSLPSGGVMATVFADADTVRERLQIFNQSLLAAEASGRIVVEETDDVLAVAAINGPKSTVVSGRAEAVAALLAGLATDGIETRPMATSHAFHSPLMEPILDAFGQTASSIGYAAPHIPLVSNLNGKLLGPGEVQDASYWRCHIREAVQFYAGMQALRDAGCTVFLEIGPQPHLTGMGRYCLPDATLAWLPSLKAGQDDWTILLDSLARLYVRGVGIDWASFDQPYARQRTELPTYPFQRERYWIEVDPRDARPSRPRGPALHPLLGRRVVSPLPIAQFESRVSSAMFPDYQPNGKMIVPEETFIDLAQAAAMAKFGPGTRSAVELALHTPLILNGEAHTLQTLLTPVEPGAARVEFFSQPDSEESWALHAAAVVTYVVLDDLPAEIVEVMSVPTTAAPASYSWAELIALPQQDRQFALAGVLRAGLAAVLRIGEERISLEHTLTGLGLDSIMAIELKAAIERSLSITIPIAALLNGPSLLELAGTLLAQAEATSAAPQCTAMGGSQVPTFPLSYGQRAMWFQHQVAPASIFNPVYAARLRSPLDLDAIRAAFQTVVARHSSLRTTFCLRDGEPMQVVADEVTLSLCHEEALGLAAAEAEARLNAFAQGPFDLEHGPLFRVYVLSIGPEEHLLAMASHHLVTDLWSQAIIVHEVAQLYALPERAATLPQPGLHLADYVRWQHDLLAGPTGEQLWDYWRQQLAGELPVLHLPTARLRPPLQTYSGDRRSRALGAELTGRLRALSEHAGTTLYATLLAAFHALLFRYTGQSDIIVGTATNGRSQASMADVVGYFVNSLPVRANVVPDQPFSTLLAQVKQTVVDAIAHQDYPLALLVERLRPARDLSRTPLFQVMFVFQRAHLMNDEGLSSFAISGSPGQLSMGPLRLESVGLETQGSPFDMTLMMVEAEHGLQAEITFNTDLFDGVAIERMLGHLEIMLASVVANPEQPVGRLALMPASELDRVVKQFNATNAALPINQPIHAIFEAYVERTPEAIAVVDHSATWPHAAGTAVSYRELDLRANQLAHYLRARGVGPDVPVAICLERSLDLVVAILGVLKAGGAYIPVDPAYPADRISFMLADAQPAVLLTTMALQTSLNETLNRAGQDGVLEQTPTVVLDAEWSLIANAPATRPQSLADAHNLAYIIYTSGSTGRPKGVMIEHRGLCNLVLAQIAGFGVTAASRVLQFASFSFDASVSEIFMALACGARLVLAGRETLLSSTALPQLMRDEAISVVTLPPSLLSILVPEELPGLRTLISAGEALPVELARRWSLGRRMFNAYGPTETTIGPTFFDTAELDPAATTVPIGRPIANTQIYILDALQQPVPLGVLGEISIGGVGLARGYLKRPELTAERFVEIGDWAAAPDGRPTRLYRTGDLGRFRADGSIEYLGRVDHQVKIRGLRIELGEIESQLRSHPALREAYVIAREDTPGNRRLVAYIVRAEALLAPGVSEPGTQIHHELRTYLQSRLPDYMLPAAFVELDALPLTPNGKVDLRALPAPGSGSRTGPDLVLPRNELERSLAKIWGEVLGVERVGINDNFFELGGHSLLMVKVHGQVQELVRREISIVEMFRYPTISLLAAYLSSGADTAHELHTKSAARAVRQQAAIQQQQQRMQAISQRRRSTNQRG